MLVAIGVSLLSLATLKYITIIWLVKYIVPQVWVVEHDGLVFGSGWHHDAPGG